MAEVSFLSGGGEMGALMRAHAWPQHPLGPPQAWPQALRTGIRLMLNSRHQMCLFWGTDSFWFYNDAYRQTLTDERHSSSLGLPALQVWPEVWDEVVGAQIKQVMSGGSATWHENQLQVLRRNGRDEDTYWTCSYGPIDDETASGSVGGVMVVCSETTEQVLVSKRAAAERMHGRARTWQLSPDILGVLNAEGIFEVSNPAWQTILGWPEETITSKPFFDFLHPDDLERNQLAFARAIELGEPALRFENRYRHANGGYRWLSWVAIPEGDKIYCSARDITSEKEAAESLARTEAALRQAQKMEAVGQLTGGLAHDFNNLLGGIMGALEVAQIKLDQGKVEDVPRYLSLGEIAVRRAASLTQRLLAFSRQQTLDPRATAINRLVAGMEDLIRGTIGPSVHLDVVGAHGLWPTLVDPPQLENALLNLCINARDAMPDGGRLTIETANRSLDEYAAAACELEPGQYVALSVTDTGTGMSEDVIARAFDPFFTTKPIGQGTGLGLSMIYGFARQSGGQARIYSEPGSGSTVCIYLPRHHEAPVDAETSSAARPARVTPRQEAILVVQDEPSIRELVCEILEGSGYNVLQAGDGNAGLQVLQSTATIDLLITDVGLPGAMNGRQMADVARTTRPQLKILFMTGYAENSVVGNGHLEPGMHLLTKPFSLAALKRKIHELLPG